MPLTMVPAVSSSSLAMNHGSYSCLAARWSMQRGVSEHLPASADSACLDIRLRPAVPCGVPNAPLHIVEINPAGAPESLRLKHQHGPEQEVGPIIFVNDSLRRLTQLFSAGVGGRQ